MEDKGVYTVSSGYHTLNHQEDNESDGQGWESIWKMKVKVKNLIWRACANTLPTMQALQQRRIIEDNLCLTYHKEPESVFHATYILSRGQRNLDVGATLYS